MLVYISTAISKIYKVIIVEKGSHAEITLVDFDYTVKAL